MTEDKECSHFNWKYFSSSEIGNIFKICTPSNYIKQKLQRIAKRNWQMNIVNFNITSLSQKLTAQTVKILVRIRNI